MIRYRLYTENVNRNFVDDLFKVSFDSFTVYMGVGFWKGFRENGLVYEVITEIERLDEIRAIAKLIKPRNKQETVLLTKEIIEGELI